MVVLQSFVLFLLTLSLASPSALPATNDSNADIIIDEAATDQSILADLKLPEGQGDVSIPQSEPEPKFLEANYTDNLDEENLGGACTSDELCKGEHSICKNSFCVCADTFVKASNRKACIKIANQLGEPCEETVQCKEGGKLGNAICKENSCSCIDGSIIKNDVCVEEKELGETCSSEKPCSVSNSTCQQGTCVCVTGMVPHYSNKECLPVQEKIGSQCETELECTTLMSDRANCVARVCVCKTGSHFNGTQCIKNLVLGDKCTKRNDCTNAEEIGDRRDCINGKCACEEQYPESREEDMCLKKIVAARESFSTPDDANTNKAIAAIISLTLVLHYAVQNSY